MVLEDRDIQQEYMVQMGQVGQCHQYTATIAVQDTRRTSKSNHHDLKVSLRLEAGISVLLLKHMNDLHMFVNLDALTSS